MIGYTHANARLPKLAFQESIAAKKVRIGPKIRSIIPTGLKRFANRTPVVIPITAGRPHKNGRGVKHSLILTWTHEYPKEPKETVSTMYKQERIMLRAI